MLQLEIFIAGTRRQKSCNHFWQVLELDDVEFVFAGTGKINCWNQQDFLLHRQGMSAGEHTGEHAGELRSSPPELQQLPRKLQPQGWAVACAEPVTRTAGEGWDRRPWRPAKTAGEGGEGGDDRRGGQARGRRRGRTRAAGETRLLFSYALARGRRRSELARSGWIKIQWLRTDRSDG